MITVEVRAECAAIKENTHKKKNTSKLRKHLHKNDNTCAANTHNTT